MSEKSEHIIRAEHFKSGWESGEEAERERIIAILETMRDKTHEDSWDALDDAIALIKGENE